MTCCIARPVRPTIFGIDDVGKHLEFLEFDCECNSCCKRVTLFAPKPLTLASDEWFIKLIADIRFGCKKSCFGGNVEVDFKNGVILDLSGDYVSVAYKVIEVAPNGLEGGTLPPISLGAMVACCGAGAARGCATRTTERFNVASGGGNSPLIPIPPFAYAVQFVPTIGTDFFLADVNIVQFGSGTNSFSSLLAGTTADTIPDPWALVNGARNIFVNNNTTDTELSFEVVFLIGV